MIKRFTYLFLASAFLASCTGFKDVSIEDDQPLAQVDSAETYTPGTPVADFQNGIFYDLNSDLGKWEASHANVVVGKKGTSMIISLKNVGVDWEQVSRKLPPIDFTSGQKLLVKAKALGTDTAKVRIDLVDIDGHSTNYSPQEKLIVPTSDFRDYVFDYENRWTQNWPARADVNKTKITEIKMNFNGGGPNFTGKILIDQIVIIPSNKTF